jgi:hypothetical protein
MIGGPELSRAERLKLWQALKNAKKNQKDDKDSTNKSFERSNSGEIPLPLKKRNRKKYIEKTYSSSDYKISKPRPKSEGNESFGESENNDPNNEFEKAAACLHQKFRNIRLSDEFDENFSFSNRDSRHSGGRRSSILMDGYHTADDSTPVPTIKKSTIGSRSSYDSDETYHLQARLNCMEAENALLKLRVADANSVKREAVERLQMCMEESQSQAFHNEILNQRISELESSQSMDRMNTHEVESQKSQKHKKEIKMLKDKNNEYEKRANAMVAEMADQMAALQDMAMKRIEVNSYHTLIALFN